MSGITTHVLDTSRGRPAAGIAIHLDRLLSEDRWEVVGRGVTDIDGRARDLVAPGTLLTAGNYRLRFATAAYFAAADVATFYPEVQITFNIVHPTQHHHVPLLLSPFGYSTYRGS